MLLGLGLLAAAHAPAGADHGDGAESAGLPQLDLTTWPGQIFWLGVSFVVLYVVLSRSILPRIGAVIEDRRDKIADDLDEAKRLQRSAEEAQERHEKALADARAKAHAISADTHAAIEAELAAEAEAAETDVAAKAAEAETRIQAAAQSALASVKSVAGEAATALVEKLSGAAPSASAVAAALDAVDRR